MRRRDRSNRGQALTEGVGALALITALSVGVVLLILGTGTLAFYKIKIAAVTDAAAKVAVDDRFWLGAQRPNYDPSAAASHAAATANTMLGQLGLPPAASFTFDDSSIPGFVKITITVNALRIVSGGILPGLVSMTDTAIEPYILQLPIATATLNYTDATHKRIIGLDVPAYVATSAFFTCPPGGYPATGKFPFYFLEGPFTGPSPASAGPFDENCCSPFTGY